MKTSIVFKEWLIVGSVMALGFATCAVASAQSQTNKVRIGVYDSRAVAVAYANSTAFREDMKTVEDEYQKAKAGGDEKRMKEIDSRMKLQQRRLHEQGFSTGSVAPILAKVKEAMPEVAKQADVQFIVSKWELTWQSPNVELVDVTDKIVSLFHVNERGLKWAKEITQKPPLPIEQITDDMD